MRVSDDVDVHPRRGKRTHRTGESGALHDCSDTPEGNHSFHEMADRGQTVATT